MSPIRKGTHRCNLPSPYVDYDWSHRDLIRCDTCGRRYQLWAPDGWSPRWAYEWCRIGRLTAWLLSRSRRDAPQPPEPERCRSCNRAYEAGEEWCPACTICPEHGGLRTSPRSDQGCFDCDRRKALDTTA